MSVQRFSGGTQRSQGAFIQDVITPVEKLVITLNARVDNWRNYNGHNLETTVATGLPTANNRPSIDDRTDTVVSPRVAALYHVTDRVTAWGAFNSGFRAPTLTELYRQFSVGAITTRPNAQLGPERLLGGELGVNIAPGQEPHRARHLVRQPREGSGIERDDDRRPAEFRDGVRRARCRQLRPEAEPGPDADPGRPDRCRVPPRS